MWPIMQEKSSQWKQTQGKNLRISKDFKMSTVNMFKYLKKI